MCCHFWQWRVRLWIILPHSWGNRILAPSCDDEFRRYKYTVRDKRRSKSQIDKFYFLRTSVCETGESNNGHTRFNYRWSQSVTTILMDAQFDPPAQFEGELCCNLHCIIFLYKFLNLIVSPSAVYKSAYQTFH